MPDHFDNIIAYCVKTGNLDLSYVLEEGLLRTDMIIHPKKEKLEKNSRNFCLSKKQFYRKMPVQKTAWMGPGLVPAPRLIHNLIAPVHSTC